MTQSSMITLTKDGSTKNLMKMETPENLQAKALRFKQIHGLMNLLKFWTMTLLMKCLILYGEKLGREEHLRESIFVSMLKIQENILKESIMLFRRGNMLIVLSDMNSTLIICLWIMQIYLNWIKSRKGDLRIWQRQKNWKTCNARLFWWKSDMTTVEQWIR